MNHGILIVSGYNMRAVIAFCRWASARALPFYLVAKGEDDPIWLTAYRDRVLLTRTSAQLDATRLIEWMEQLRRRHGHQRTLLLPSTEFLNRCMLADRAALEAAGAIIPLVDRALYEQFSDKYSFGELCRQAGIAVPFEYDSLPGHFPFVAKPRNYAAISARQLKPHLVYDEAGLQRFLADEDGADYYYQQFIEGRSLYLLAHVPRSGAPALFSQENLVQQKDGGSVILARASDFHLHRPARPYLDLLAHCGFYGLVMIEVRFEPASGKYYMIEANPRLWGPMQLVVDNHTGIFDSLLRDYGYDWQDLPAQPAQPYYFWSGGLADGAGVRYHHYSAAELADNFQSIERASLFLRDDTMPLFRHELAPANALVNHCANDTMTQPTLAELYSRNSKHSNYQLLARPLHALLAHTPLEISSRHEIARLDYLLARHPVQGLQLADIGGNTGFFTLECAAAGAARVLYIEGNAAHAQFVALSAQALQLQDVVACRQAYLDFRDDADFPAPVDMCLLLNVLHHLGDDYGDAALSRDAAKQGMLASLAYMARHARLLVFQLGFNWKGDRTLPLFEHGSKAELIEFIRQGSAADWEMIDIGIAERDATSGKVAYHELNDRNIARDDSLGEFLNRPLFILRSKHI